jgi:hypothetical protein
MAQATIPKKSATATEVLRVKVNANIAGVLTDPTGFAVSAAVRWVNDPTTRVPATGDYVAQTWETGSGPRYWAAVLMGPAASLDPAGPGTGVAEVVYELWIRVVAGSEDVRRLVGQFAVTP